MAIELGFRGIFPQAEYIRLPIAVGGSATVDGGMTMYPTGCTGFVYWVNTQDEIK